jgi:excisionase family DNA binding protein
MTVYQLHGLDVDELPTVLTVEQAGCLLGLGRTASYDAVRRGELPVLRFGRRLVVPANAILRMLALERDEGAPTGAPVDQLDPAATAKDRYEGS